MLEALPMIRTSAAGVSASGDAPARQASAILSLALAAVEGATPAGSATIMCCTKWHVHQVGQRARVPAADRAEPIHRPRPHRAATPGQARAASIACPTADLKQD